MNESITKQTAPRLIIPISDCLINNTDFAYEVYRRADMAHASVLYLVMISDEHEYLNTFREMVTMQAVTSSNNLSVEVKIVHRQHWFSMLKELITPIDIILCQKEYMVSIGFFKSVSFSSFLGKHIPNMIQIMDGYYPPNQFIQKKISKEFFAVVGFVLILFLFTGLEISIEHTLADVLSKVLISFTFLLEVCAVLFWNRLFL